LVIGRITRVDVPVLCERLRVLVDGSELDVVACDVGALGADLAALEALARLQLTARQLGCRVRLRHASRELEALLAFCGLGAVLPSDRLRLGPSGQTEDGNRRGVSRNELSPMIRPAEISIT